MLKLIKFLLFIDKRLEDAKKILKVLNLFVCIIVNFVDTYFVPTFIDKLL